MKILVLSQYWWPENGVPQRRWEWLSQTLIDAGHEVFVVAPPPHYQRKMTLAEWWKSRRSSDGPHTGMEIGPAGETIYRSDFFPAGPSLTQRAFNQATVALGSIGAVLRRGGAVRKFQPDVVIGTVPALPTAVATQAVAKLLQAPYIVDLRDAWPDLLEEAGSWNKSTLKTSMRERILRRGPLQIVSFLTRRAIDRSLKRAEAIIVTSAHLEDELRKRPALKTRSGDPLLTTVRNVFPAETQFEKDSTPQPPNGHLKVLYAGTIGRAQNLSNVLRAAELAREQGLEISLRFVGAGVSRRALQQDAKRTGLDVTFDARQDAANLAKYYSWADTALVHLTDWEALQRAVPSKTYELMSAKIHISGVVAGEAAELIQTLDAGDVVEPENPRALAELWLKLAGDRSVLTRSDRARDWVVHERTSVAPQRFLEIVENIPTP